MTTKPVSEFSHELLSWARKGFRYNNYKFYLEDKFGGRVQRISVEGGFTCPNRDGSKGSGGCNYCNNESFAPGYARRDRSIREQIAEGKERLNKRFGAESFIAYFQSYSNTYGQTDYLRSLYEDALDDPDIKGLSVSTRSDCIDESIAAMLGDLASETYVNVEIGIESIHNESLEWMNRCHDMKDTHRAFDILARYPQIELTGHIILGLPVESRDQMMDYIPVINSLPLKFLKIHHLQVIRGTRLAVDYEKQAFPLLDYESYLHLVTEFLEGLRHSLVLQRVFSDCPEKYLIAPRWGRTQTAIVMDLQRFMRDNDSFQGKYYNS